MKKVCILNTGGTIGMKPGKDGFQPSAGFLGKQLAEIVELRSNETPDHTLIEFNPVIDSSNMSPDTWLEIASQVSGRYSEFDGFVIIHGTDTLAYTASALPFMLKGLGKPVILTGSQIPLCQVRNDARENLVTALLLAVNYYVPEVTIFFGNRLLRGCRSKKVSANRFQAFDSPNFPPLGTVGTDINIFTHNVRIPETQTNLELLPIERQAIATFRLFPGVSHRVIDNVLRQPLVALILESYGVGNGPANDQELLRVIREATDNGIVIVNCTQCHHGRVSQTDYAVGTAFEQAGVVSGSDMTVEAALAKLQFLFTHHEDVSTIKSLVAKNLVGELTPVE